MLPPESPDRIHVAFDDHRLVGNAGLILLVSLALHLGLGKLVNTGTNVLRLEGGFPSRISMPLRAKSCAF